MRVTLFAQAAKETVMQTRLLKEAHAKQTLALEKLLLSLTLTLCVPGVDVRDLTETLEQIEDLMECFAQLKLGSPSGAESNSNPKKKAKRETAGASEQRKKALAVLFDLLIA